MTFSERNRLMAIKCNAEKLSDTSTFDLQVYLDSLTKQELELFLDYIEAVNNELEGKLYV